MMVIFDKEVCRAMASLRNALRTLKRVARRRLLGYGM